MIGRSGRALSRCSAGMNIRRSELFPDWEQLGFFLRSQADLRRDILCRIFPKTIDKKRKKSYTKLV